MEKGGVGLGAGRGCGQIARIFGERHAMMDDQAGVSRPVAWVRIGFDVMCS